MSNVNSDTLPVEPAHVAEVRSWKMDRPVLACHFDPTGRYVVAGGMETRIAQFDLTAVDTPDEDESGVEKSPDKQLPGVRVEVGRSWTTSMLFSEDGQRLFVSDYTGQLMAFDFPLQNEEQTPIWKCQAHKGCLRMIALSPDGHLLATCGTDDSVRLWSTDNGQPSGVLSGHKGDVYGVAFHPKGRQQLVSGDVTGVIKHWNTESHETIRELDMKLMFKQEGPIRVGGARSMTFDREGTVLACGGLGQIKRVNSPQGVATVLLFDWETGQQHALLRPNGNTDGYVNGLAFHRNGYVVGMTGGASSRAGTLMFWRVPVEQPSTEGEAPRPAEVKTFLEFKTATSGWAMDLHPDETQIAVAHHDKQLRLYDLSQKPAPSNETDSQPPDGK